MSKKKWQPIDVESCCIYVTVPTSVHPYKYMQVNVKNGRCHIYYQHALLTPLANCRSIVGLQLPTLDFTSFRPPCCMLWRVVASVCPPLPTWTETRVNLMYPLTETCYWRHISARAPRIYVMCPFRNATTPNILGPTILGVVASVYT